VCGYDSAPAFICSVFFLLDLCMDLSNRACQNGMSGSINGGCQRNLCNREKTKK
jgi:hypothetical protein